MHVEALDDPGRALAAAAGLGLDAGLALKPATPLDTVLPYLDRLDLVLTMTVEPGFGGQAFDDQVLPKVAAASRAIAGAGRPVALQVDGGVNAATLPRCQQAGADVFVVGTAIFGADDPAAAAKAFKELIDGGAG
jgi:ribulose-phosphate 3-epimerase